MHAIDSSRPSMAAAVASRRSMSRDGSDSPCRPETTCRRGGSAGGEAAAGDGSDARTACRKATRSSASTVSARTSGFMRPMAASHQVERLRSRERGPRRRGSSPRGMVRSGASGNPRGTRSPKSGGETPTTVNVMPLMVTGLPTAGSSVPNRRTRYWWLITTTGSADSSSSRGMRVRPAAASTPSSAWKLPDTNWPLANSALPSANAFSGPEGANAARPESDRPARRSCSTTSNGNVCPPRVPSASARWA